MEVYSAFYRKYGVRTQEKMVSPTVSTILTLALPKNSIVHHLSVDDISIGPEPEGIAFMQYSARKLVEHVQVLSNPIGKPKPNRVNIPGRLVKDYHRRFRTMRPLHNFNKSLRDENALIIVNYAHLNQLFMYIRSIYSQYYKWINIYKTVTDNVNNRCKDNERQHFIFLELPQILPNPASLNQASGPVTKLATGKVEMFSKPQALLILEMWKFLGDKGQDSIFDSIDPENFSKINLVWTDSGNWITINLGVLLGVDEKAAKDDSDKEVSTQLQRRFLRMLMALLEQRSQSNPTEDTECIVVKCPDEAKDDAPVELPKEEDKHRDLLDEVAIAEDLKQFDKISESAPVEASVILDKYDVEISDKITVKCDELADTGKLSAAEYRRYMAMIDKSKAIPNPFGKGTFEEFRKVESKDLMVNEDLTKMLPITGVIDESQLVSSLKAMDSQYIQNVMIKDISNAAMAIQDAGVIVTSYDVKDVEDYANNYQIVTMKLNPVDGDGSTVRFRLPKVDQQGEFIANGVKYRLRKQRSDKPIRKTAPDTVALTSYYAKVFVTRSNKSVVNYSRWIMRQLTAMGIDDNNPKVTKYRHNKTLVTNVKLPRIYTILAGGVREFTIDGKHRIYVDHIRRNDEFGEEFVSMHEQNGMTFSGMSGKTPILVDEFNSFYLAKDSGLEALGKIEDLLDLDASKAPSEIAEFSLFSKSIPVAMALGYHYGLTNLMNILGVKPRRVPIGEKANVTESEYAIKFSDETLVFSKDNYKAQLVLAGFNRYHRAVVKYTVRSFDDKDVYVNIMEDSSIRIGFIRELELAMDMFVDPITKSYLEEMKEPTTLSQLLIRSCELLTLDWHPEETDLSDMRIRGYERMAGAVYSEMVRGVRKYRARGVGKAAKIEINPEAVWHAINQDPSISQVEESNPIQNLKEQELVTYMGTGGRSTRSMVKHTRAFHKSDMGVISEATVDSGAVGVNSYLTANPQFTDLRGTAKEYDPDNVGNSSLVSTSVLLAPASNYDDPKRANFISIQNSHTVASAGNTPSPLRTGYERVMAHRVGDLFAHVAKADGVVKKIDSKGAVTVVYKDGTEDIVEIGTRYGNVPGSTIPHELVTNLSVGDKVKEGNIVAYNKGFFSPDPLDPTQVLMKSGTMVRTAIMENPYTLEDASVISQKVAKQLNTSVTHVRTVVVKFDQVVRNLVTKGSTLDLESILCTIEDQASAGNDLFDEDSLDILKLMSANAPKSKYVGVVEKIEAIYHGDTEDMSDSVLSIVKASDRERLSKLKALGKTATTGSVNGLVRIDKEPLDLDTVAIRIYITSSMDGGIGDKGVFANQMKSIFSNVMDGTNKTEDGEDIDAIFSYLSISNRIVLSAEIIGTTNSLLKTMSKMVVDDYFSNK